MNIGLYLLGEKGFRVLESILESFGSHHISFVVIGLDKNIKNDYYLEIEDTCAKHGVIKYNRNEEIKDIATISFAVGWRWIIKKHDNLIVLHDSILPKYRGFSPLVNMLINGEEKIGVTALYASMEYDRGDIISSESVNINYPIKVDDAISLVSELYSRIVIKIISDIVNNKRIEAFSQIDDDATYSIWRDENDYNIDWNKSAIYIKRFVDSVSHPYKGAKTYFNGNCIRVHDIEIIEDVTVEDRENNIGKQIWTHQGKPVIICGQGLALLKDFSMEESSENLLLPFRLRLSNEKV